MTERIQLVSAVFALVTGVTVYLMKGRAWVRRVRERRLRGSAVFAEVQAFMKASEVKHDRLAQSINRVHQSVLRLTLFNQTISRRVHEQQLTAGKEYLDLGGNGPAEAQYEVLYQDYLARSKNNDWRYRREDEA